MFLRMDYPEAEGEGDGDVDGDGHIKGNKAQNKNEAPFQLFFFSFFLSSVPLFFLFFKGHWFACGDG